MANFPTFLSTIQDGFSYNNFLLSQVGNSSNLYDLLATKMNWGNLPIIPQYDGYYKPEYVIGLIDHKFQNGKAFEYNSTATMIREYGFEGALKNLDQRFEIVSDEKGELFHFLGVHTTSPDTHIGESIGGFAQLTMIGTFAANKTILENLKLYFSGKNLEKAMDIITQDVNLFDPLTGENYRAPIFFKEYFKQDALLEDPYISGHAGRAAAITPFYNNELGITIDTSQVKKHIDNTFDSLLTTSSFISSSFIASYLRNRIEIEHQVDLRKAGFEAGEILPANSIALSGKEQEFLLSNIKRRLEGDRNLEPLPKVKDNFNISAAKNMEKDIRRLENLILY